MLRDGFQGGGLCAGVREIGEIALERKEAFSMLELLCCHLGSPPFGSEWVFWVPREANMAADFLAGKAIVERQDRMFLNYLWRSFGRRPVVGVSDAGVRKAVGGEHVGIGWMLVDRETRKCIVAAQWYRWAAETDRRWGHREDVNLWEARTPEIPIPEDATIWRS